MDIRVAVEAKKYYKVGSVSISQTGGGKKWECLFCKKTIIGTATRLRAHLLGLRGFNVAACEDVSKETQSAITNLEAEHPVKKAGQPARSYALSSSNSSRQPGMVAWQS